MADTRLELEFDRAVREYGWCHDCERFGDRCECAPEECDHPDGFEEKRIGESYKYVCPGCGETRDEPPGAGRDPYGRPSPRTHPEFWTE